MVIFANFASQTSQKFALQYMSIYSNENIRKITKLSPREFPHLVQNCENICMQNIWLIQYLYNIWIYKVKKDIVPIDWAKLMCTFPECNLMQCNIIELYCVCNNCLLFFQSMFCQSGNIMEQAGWTEVEGWNGKKTRGWKRGRRRREWRWSRIWRILKLEIERGLEVTFQMDYSCLF